MVTPLHFDIREKRMAFSVNLFLAIYLPIHFSLGLIGCIINCVVSGVLLYFLGVLAGSTGGGSEGCNGQDVLGVVLLLLFTVGSVAMCLLGPVAILVVLAVYAILGIWACVSSCRERGAAQV